MKIVHADTDDLDNPLGGGQPVRTFEVNSRLAGQHDVTVLTATYRGAQRRQERAGVHYRRLGVRVPPFGLSPHASFLASLGPAVALMRPDLMVEEFTPPVGFCGLPLWSPAPIVSVVQWHFFQFWEERYHLPFERWSQRLATRGRYRHFIVLSHAMGGWFRELIPDAVVQRIPEGVTEEAFVEPQGDGDYVMFLGRLDKRQKGLDLLIDAWADLCGQGEPLPLRVVGAGDDRKSLERQVEQAGLGRWVTFVGRLDGQAKRDALAGCRLLVMPSRAETFGITALEAMAAGRPVVASNIDHLNEVVRPSHGSLVDVDNREQLARAVRALWNAPKTARALGAEGQKAARGYLWDEIARQQDAFYGDVVADHGRPAT